MAGKIMATYNITNVPALDPNDFGVWKDRMTKYMDSIDDRLMMCGTANLGVFTSNQKLIELLNMGQVENARYLFDEMPEKDEFTRNTMITGFASKGKLVEARKLLEKNYKNSS